MTTSTNGHQEQIDSSELSAMALQIDSLLAVVEDSLHRQEVSQPAAVAMVAVWANALNNQPNSNKIMPNVGDFMRYLIMLGLLVAGTAAAGPIHYELTATPTDGPLTGQSFNGSSSYESPGASQHLGLRLLDFDFTLNDITYTAADVLFAAVWLDRDGRLDFSQAAGSFFGSMCESGGCKINWGMNTWTNMLGMPYYSIPHFLKYRTPDGGNTGIGSISVSQAVPEPATLAMLGMGLLLLLLGLMRTTAVRPSSAS